MKQPFAKWLILYSSFQGAIKKEQAEIPNCPHNEYNVDMGSRAGDCTAACGSEANFQSCLQVIPTEKYLPLSRQPTWQEGGRKGLGRKE